MTLADIETRLRTVPSLSVTWDHPGLPGWEASDYPALARVVQEMLAEQRERDAKIAENWEPPTEQPHIGGWECEQTCVGIAAAIRRGEE